MLRTLSEYIISATRILRTLQKGSLRTPRMVLKRLGSEPFINTEIVKGNGSENHKKGFFKNHF
jgi:hypothetical protein